MKPIYFLHIPKTSGTSINSAIENAYGTENTFQYKTWGYINEREEKIGLVNDLYSQRYKFVTGHYGWNERISSNRFVFCMFRNPVSRTVSQLQHIYKYRPNPIWSNNEYDFSEGLLTSIFNQKLSKYISNVQTKYLLGNVDMFEKIKVTDRNEFIFLEDDEEFQQNTSKFQPLVYWNIVNKLMKLDAFGLQEFHKESLILLSDKIGVSLSIKLDKENISLIDSDTFTPTQNELLRLKNINNYDIFLYNLAKRIFLYRWIKFINTKLNLKLSLSSYLKDREKYLEMFSN